MKASSVDECRQFVDKPAITFARVFAENDGRGKEVETAFTKLESKEGRGFANSVRALCWFLLWGSIGGNTINGFIARLKLKPKLDSSFLFEFFFFVYYGLLFLIIAVVNGLLKFFPKVPKWFSASFGVLLTVIAGTWILVPGLLGKILPSKPGILQLN